jgi:hypothetical protein
VLVRSIWNRSRTTAIAATLLLHLVLAAWLLSLKINETSPAVDIDEIEWIPPSEPLPPVPPPDPASFSGEPVAAPTILLPVPEEIPPLDARHDWYGDARAVAGALRGSPERRSFGPGPEREHKLKSAPDRPPSIFEEPLPRVGKAYRTPEGESVLWISDYCYISLDSQSLTMKDIHDSRKGVRTCIIPIGKRKARGDLFDHLKRPPAGQPEGQAPGQQ